MLVSGFGAMITGIDHIQLAMPLGGEERARAFYAGLLGMEEEEKPEPLASRGGCWFASGRSKLHLGVEDPFTPQKKAHPGFLSMDLDALAMQLAGAGHPVSWDDALAGRRRFYTEDPFGNRLEVMRDGDGFSQR